MQIALINNRKPFQKMISRPLLSRAISNNIWMGSPKNSGNIELRQLSGKEEEQTEQQGR